MTALGIEMSDTDVTHDWTGLTSGHKRPAKVQAAYENMLDAWTQANAIADLYEDGKVSREQVTASAELARLYDKEYHWIYKVWQTSMEECECRPLTPDRDYICAACRAKAELSNDGEMPF